MRTDKDIGELGRLLAVVETVLGAIGTADAPLHRASLALRMTPGEYDSAWIGVIARAAAAQPDTAFVAHDVLELEQARTTAQSTIEKIRVSYQCCTTLAKDAKNSDRVRQISERAAQLLLRLEMAYRSSGISHALPDGSAEEIIEQLSMTKELTVRLEKIRTECLWATPGRSLLDEEKLVSVWQTMA